ncbi:MULTISPECIES: hypothetical protein [unclassified Clostridium]|nr:MULTISPECIES: hypothetical protein [unclassified Clostridium]
MKKIMEHWVHKITWLYIGYFMVSKAQGWYDSIMSCKLVELLGYIFG